jgi:hypothetical protein
MCSLATFSGFSNGEPKASRPAPAAAAGVDPCLPVLRRQAVSCCQVYGQAEAVCASSYLDGHTASQ